MQEVVRSPRWLCMRFMALTTVWAVGCGCAMTGYVGHVIAGEFELLTSAVPIEDALADPTLTDEQREKLALLVEARDYAEQVVGLHVGNSYRRFANLHGRALAWNLTGSHKDRIEPHMWNLPIVGPLPYLGFFDFDRAAAERDRLVKAGFDTLIYEVDAFSTLGLLPDPVASPLLERPIYSFVDTVFHELLHNTIWSGTDVVYDESMANFVGRTAGLEFLAVRFGPDSPHIEKALQSYEDVARLNDFLATLRDELEALYDSDLSREEKLEAREPIFEAARQRVVDELLPLMHDPDRFAHYGETTLNNAFLLLNLRYYSEMELFDTIYNHVDRDWASALELYDVAARTADPFATLRGFVIE
jgi:predicted aminopeptidase